MSMTEILDELPSLSTSERRTLCRKLMEMEGEHEDIEICNATAREGFAMLDRMEAQDDANARSS